jgi:enediyne polyketide synthase
VPERAHRRIRLAALAAENGDVDVVLRSDETGFAADHFRGRCGAARPATAAGESPDVLAEPAGEPMPGRELYGPLFFHGPALHRVRGYHRLSAYRCLGSVVADPAARWFGAFHDQRLVLGDPGVRDAYLHILQGCLPDRRLLPVAVDEIRFHRRPEGTLTVHARQRAEDADEITFDLVVGSAEQVVVEEWHGLRLRMVGPIDQPCLPLAALGAQLTRSLRRAHPQVTLDLAVAPADRTDRGRTLEVAAWLAGAPVEHAPDGGLTVRGAGQVSASHLDGHVLVAAGADRVGVDWEAITAADAPLGAGDRAVAAELARADGQDEHAAGYRVWTCRETLRKLGRAAAEPLLVAGPPGAGWATLTSGGHRLHSIVVATGAGPVAVCVGTGWPR